MDGVCLLHLHRLPYALESDRDAFWYRFVSIELTTRLVLRNALFSSRVAHGSSVELAGTSIHLNNQCHDPGKLTPQASLPEKRAVFAFSTQNPVKPPFLASSFESITYSQIKLPIHPLQFSILELIEKLIRKAPISSRGLSPLESIFCPLNSLVSIFYLAKTK